MPDQVVLGFDFGLKHIGVAVGQTFTRTTQAVTSLSAHNGIPHWDEVAKIIRTWQPHLLVVGIPLNMDGSEQPLTQQARQFAQQLMQHFQLPVHYMDERLSSAAARSLLFERGGYKALKKKSIDTLAAQLILESWLLEQK